MADRFWQASALELRARFARREASPVEVVEALLARIDTLNPALNAVVTVDAAGARIAARESEQRWRAGAALSPLDGVPITVKDSIPVRGMRASWGSRLYADYVPARDELPIARLRAAGVVILGKTNCPELTVQGYTDNALFGPTRNPWDLALTPGGSSGGAVAAVAAGLGPIAIGTDGGGSIRRPAGYTGLVGLKPSRGRVARCDGFPAVMADFEVIGPFTRTVADLVAVMGLISDPDPRDPASLVWAGGPFALPPLRRLSIRYTPNFGGLPVEPVIAASIAEVADMLSRLGHRVEQAEAPYDVESLNRVWPVLVQAGLASLLGGRAVAESGLTASIAEAAEAGRKLTAAAYVEAMEVVAQVKCRVAEFFAGTDLLLTPSAAAMPWPAQDIYPPTIAGLPAGPRTHAVFTGFANAAGLPGITVPARPAPAGGPWAGIPIGAQLVGPPGSDGLLCAVAAEMEQVSPWEGRWPPLAGA